jgi:hypothetical protein
MADYPYIKVILMDDLLTNDDDGYSHVPVAVESSPGLNVKKILQFTVESLEREEALREDDR